MTVTPGREAEAGHGVNLRALSAWLVAEHGYAGSYKAIQRFVRAKYAKPRLRVRLRVETPPGAQAQADWGAFPGLVIVEVEVQLQAFHLVLSHSRYEAIVWSERQDELAGLTVHNAALVRLGGVPAVIRVDNTKTDLEQGSTRCPRARATAGTAAPRPNRRTARAGCGSSWGCFRR